MEESNNRHHRYTTASTSGITVLRMVDSTFIDNPLPLLQKLVKAYDEEMLNSSVNYETLKDFYKVLCYEYQMKFKSEPKLKAPNNDLAGFPITKILQYIMRREEGIEDGRMPIVIDVIILQIALHSNAEQIMSLFQYLSAIDKKILNVDVYLLGIIDCITEAVYLKSYIYEENDLNEINMKEICQSHMNQITLCLFRLENPQWKLFISILTKMIVTFDQTLVVSHLWEIVLNENYNDYEKKLTLLSCILDDILSLPGKEIIKCNIEYCSKENIWLFIFNGLTSNVEQQRKQTSYIMKSILRFIEPYHELSLKKNIIPFVHCRREDERQYLKQIMMNFFLILESLEEKQGHLVTPVLAHLKELMKVNIDHQACGNCFDRIWLRCIFQRILQHKTNAVMKLGLLNLIKMDPTAFDEVFVSLLVQSLNNTSLYDNKDMKCLPEIPKKLADLFIKAEYSNVDLINEFIHAVSRITWAPIPLFYIFESLKVTTAQLKNTEYNIWSESELEAIITIMEKNLSIQSPPMRDDIQINICKMFFCCAKQPLDLNILAKTFSAFPSSKIMNRGSKCWNLIADYLQSNINTKDAVEYICQMCDKLLIKEYGEGINLKSLALIIVLLYDGKKIFVSKSCPVQKFLCDTFDLIRGADVRSYADTTLCLRTIQLIKCLLNVLLVQQKDTTTPEKGNFINHLIFPYLDPAQRFIFKSLKQSSSPKTYDEATIYVESFNAIVAFNRFVHKSFNFSNDMKMFQDETIRTIDDFNGIVNLRYWYNLQILYISSMCNINTNADDHSYRNFQFKLCRQQLRLSSKTDVENGGKIISECYEIIGKSIKQFFISCTDYTLIDFHQWLINLTNLLDAGKEYVISSVLGVLRKWFDNVHDHLPLESNIFGQIIDMSWRNIWDLKKNEYFWSSINQLIGLILQTNFLNRKDLTPTVIKYVNYIILKSENIPNLKNVLIQHLLELEALDFLHFHDDVVKCLLQSAVGRMDKRIEMQTFHYIMNQHDIFDFYQYTITTSKTSGIYIDVLFRAECILLLLRVMNSVGAQYFSVNTVLFFTSILVNLKNKRYFADSNIHRIKHRVMQLLLIIQPLLDEKATTVLYDTICDLIVSESNQPSVRVMQEWLLMKIFIKYPSLRDNVWDLLEVAKTKRPGSITSVASIIYHVSRKLPIDKKVQYIRIAIRKLLSSCFRQTFVVRLYCQVILSKLFDVIQSLWSLSLDYTIIRDAITESLRCGNLNKNSIKIFEDFYFPLFDPMQDYDLQTLFYDLPRLLNMSSDELILPDIFIEIRPECDLDSDDLFHAFHIPIENKRGLLSPINSSNQRDTRNESVFNEGEDIDDDALSDVQKKIMPWKTMLPIVEESTSVRQQKLVNDTGLIVVASLIDSLPNLGGLSRTSEIFCARELVLANIKCIEYKEFQSLSVSSEKWITITEVKPHELRNYLLEKKSMGWTLVGAEQTANSISLLDMKFDKKSILLLGNEKSGIPANLIPLMDVCVEIPQAGVVRSLNVHVTGAICLWHYSKQHIF
ncbi:hypothetical protein PV327_003720 [Microctonus hyperodae]|uniref:tRNA/rRNA methyltransferase SpoU type domain-containing protein n=1 Tax=Microctonus hyperodae TaxID=165561 RepID=A0AA39G4L3_MICHY|nr:hypothetical protein PV327_003720 [Microctonus hyperodae]